MQECELDLSGKAEIITRLQARSCEVARLLSGLQKLGGPPRSAAAPAAALRPSRSAHTLQEALRRAPPPGAAAAPTPPSPRDDVTPTADVSDDVSEGVANKRMEAECGLTPDTPRSDEQEHSMDGWETIDGDDI